VTRTRWPPDVNVSWASIDRDRLSASEPEHAPARAIGCHSGSGDGLNVGSAGASRELRGLGVISLAAAAALTISVMIIAAIAGSGVGLGGGAVSTYQDGDGDGVGVSPLAQREIPSLYLRLYQQAGEHYGLDWAILAGIGRVECDHGRDPSPSCTREGAVNAAGAGGPMQFLASTWATYGVDADGGASADRWDPADAIFGAANYLKASGAPGDYAAAIFAYNHASWYVQEVKAWAARYSEPAGGGESEGGGGGSEGGRGESEGGGGEAYAGEEGSLPEGADARLQGESPTQVRFIPGQLAELAAGDGHLALVPAGVPDQVQAMVVAGNELQALPYGPAGHPDPLGASEEDCSSTVNYVLYRSGVRPLKEIVADNPVAQDYTHWGLPGPGRWVTIYATISPTPHVFMVIAGLRLDTSHDGTDVGPNRLQGGPRWRILDHIPTWAHWFVRHPPGL
jgi:hypothetical protein